MRDDELLVAEGNEDIDRICLSSGTHVEEQVKLRSKALTQGNAAIAETVLHYLEAFAYHHQNGDPFRGVLRTNTKTTVRKRTAIGNWILGNNADIANFGVELRKLVTKHKRQPERRTEARSVGCRCDE